jgi:hypothetical protein
VFTVLIGALLFGYFLTVTQTPQKVTEFLTGLGLGRYGVLALIMLMYLVLGCLMDAMAMIILTVPIIFPGHHRARLRSDLVRRHHRDDGRARADSSAGRHERVRDQERGARTSVSRRSSRRAAVRRHRSLRLVILIAFRVFDFTPALAILGAEQVAQNGEQPGRHVSARLK